MEEIVLKKQELADRWKVTTVTIDRWVADGIVSPAKGIPSIRFNLSHILELEGTDMSKMSPLARKRLEKEIKELENQKEVLEKENEELKDYVKLVFGNGARFMSI